jgi:hypothetical protein
LAAAIGLAASASMEGYRRDKLRSLRGNAVLKSLEVLAAVKVNPTGTTRQKT